MSLKTRCPDHGVRHNSTDEVVSRRRLLLASSALAAASAVGSSTAVQTVQAQPTPTPAPSSGKRPNILVIMGDDIGQTNISAYAFGVVGYKTPNIDRIAREGVMFTDYYAENSCTAGRSSFITGQTPKRTGLSKVGIPGAPIGLQAQNITIAQALKAFGLRHRPVRQEPSWATVTNSCRRCTVSTSSSAISIT